MFGTDFEMYARDRVAAKDAEASAFAEERARIRAAGGGPWTHLLGIIPRARRKAGGSVAAPAATKPVHGSR